MELPEGWFAADADTARWLHAELDRELPAGHLLWRVAVDVVAHRDGATDDILVQHRDAPSRFTVVHLTWIGRTEIDASHPTVEVDGTFEEFLAYEARFLRG